MKKATNKHRPGKGVAAPARHVITPIPAPASLKVNFYYDGRTYYWQALRSGRAIAESVEGYARRDKMKRTFLRFVESLAKGQWQLDEGTRQK